ncbi:MAG: RnfABCDGE type electron transport complex subunit D [Oscillospiraceae bacterium]|nr:RnfABCDGE type electron transport complex subunit D [Oscillospiraceae bacterium]
MKEKLMFQNAPHVRQSESVVTMMTDVIVALLPIYLMAFFYHGARSLVLGLCGALCCSVLSVLGALLLREKPVPDLTPIITGLIIPLLLPADIPYYVVISACAVAIFVVKIPFGGTGSNLFNPAAVGFASVAICWPELVFRYPATMQAIEIFGESTAKIAQSPAYSLSLGAVPDYNVLDMLLGSAPGPMGATNILVVAACGIFLIVKKAINWITPVSFIVPYALLCLLFPRIGGSPFEALCYELFSGTVVFGAFFMLTEPVTSPKRDFGKLMAGISSAIVVFLFRYFGGFEMGFASALIVMNVFSPIYDAICESVLHVSRHKETFVASIKEETKLRKNKKEEEKPVIRVIEKAKEPEELPEIKTEEISEEEILPEKEPGEIDLSENSEEKEEEALQL